MRKALVSIAVCVFLLGSASMSQAYWYSVDIQSGGIQVDLNDDSSRLSVTTTQDLVVALTYDAPVDDAPLAYSLSTDLGVGLFGGFLSTEMEINSPDEVHLWAPNITHNDYEIYGRISFKSRGDISGHFHGCEIASDRTPVFEHGVMWEIDHIKRPLSRTPLAVSCPSIDAA